MKSKYNLDSFLFTVNYILERISISLHTKHSIGLVYSVGIVSFYYWNEQELTIFLQLSSTQVKCEFNLASSLGS